MKFARKQSFLMNIESTPMADIIFLLLIFFLLSSSFILQTGTKVSLPKESRPEPLEPKHVIVTIQRNGDIFVNDDPVTINALPERLGELLKAKADQAVIVRGDEVVALGRVVEVMDIAKRTGAGRLAIATEPRRQ